MIIVRFSAKTAATATSCGPNSCQKRETLAKYRRIQRFNDHQFLLKQNAVSSGGAPPEWAGTPTIHDIYCGPRSSSSSPKLFNQPASQPISSGPLNGRRPDSAALSGARRSPRLTQTLTLKDKLFEGNMAARLPLPRAISFRGRSDSIFDSSKVKTERLVEHLGWPADSLSSASQQSRRAFVGLASVSARPADRSGPANYYCCHSVGQVRPLFRSFPCAGRGADFAPATTAAARTILVKEKNLTNCLCVQQTSENWFAESSPAILRLKAAAQQVV